MALGQRTEIKAQSNQAYSKRFCTVIPFDPGNGTRRGKECRKEGQNTIQRRLDRTQSTASPLEIHFNLLGRSLDSSLALVL